MNMKFYSSGGKKVKVEYSVPRSNVKKVNNYKSTSNVINSYASKNPSLFGTGVSSSVIKKDIDRSNLGNMLGRLSGLRSGCSTCGKK